MTGNCSTSTISTGDKGFDSILDEECQGIRNSLGLPVSVLLKGGPGCGKSTCALQLAQSYVRKYKTVCVYYALEELPTTVQMRLQTFFGDKAPESILAKVWNDTQQRQEFVKVAQEQGGVIFSQFEFKRPPQTFLPGVVDDSLLPFEVTIENLPKQLDAVKRSMPESVAPHMVVIDSLNALIALSETPSAEVPRRLLAHLLKIIGGKKFCSVFVFEEGSGGFATEEYLVDVEIEFGLSEDKKGQRYVHVLKARDHKCSPAANVMEIIDGIGIQVYPNIELASHALKEEFKPTGSAKCFGIPGLDSDLTNSDKISGLKPGSATLLIGETGTMNLLLELSFLKNSSSDEKIMLMALEGEELTINHIGRQVLADKFEKVYNEKDCHVNVRYTSPSKFVNDVSVKIHRKDNSEGHIDRLVLADLRMLFEYHKEEADEIIAYLLKLFSTHSITSVFVYTVSDVEEVLNSSIADRFENIIVTRFFEGETSGRRYLGVRVRKYDGISVNRSLRELVYKLDFETIEVTAERGVFQNLIETRPGKVGFGKLTARYYRDETPELNDFWHHIESSMTELFPKEKEVGSEKPEFKPFSFIPQETGMPSCDAVLECIAMGPTQARHPHSEIFMFDEYWAEWLIKRKRLVPINEIDPKFQFDRYFRCLNKKEYPAMLSPVLKDGILYGIPLYGNCSLIAYNKSLLKKYRDEFHPNIRNMIGVEGNINGELKWEDIFDIISVIKGKESGLVGLYLDAFSGECMSGFLLELFWGMGVVDERQCKILPNSFSSNLVLKALQEWNKRYSSCAKGDPDLGDAPQIEKIPNFIFSRIWYTRFASLKAQRPNLDIGVTKIPCWRNGTESTESAVSLSGNWYLGVLAGSVNEEWAAKAAKWITSYRANYKLAEKPIALPTYQTFWEKGLVDREIVDIYSNIKQRSRISDYIHIRPALAEACRKVIRAKEIVPRTEIEAAMNKLVRELQVITEQRERGRT